MRLIPLRKTVLIMLMWFITSKHAIAAAVTTGITVAVTAVALRFDDPIVWGCAAAGVAYTMFTTNIKSWKDGIGMGIMGMMIGAGGGPWIAPWVAWRIPENPLPACLIAFFAAALWPKFAKIAWPAIKAIVMRSIDPLRDAFIKIIGGDKK